MNHSTLSPLTDFAKSDAGRWMRETPGEHAIHAGAIEPSGRMQALIIAKLNDARRFADKKAPVAMSTIVLSYGTEYGGVIAIAVIAEPQNERIAPAFSITFYNIEDDEGTLDELLSIVGNGGGMYFICDLDANAIAARRFVLDADSCVRLLDQIAEMQICNREADVYDFDQAKELAIIEFDKVMVTRFGYSLRTPYATPSSETSPICLN